MADDLQVVLKARDEMTRDLTRATKQVAKLEAAIHEATTSGSPQAQRQIERLSRELADAQDKAKLLARATDSLDRQVDQLGGSAASTGRDFDKMGREMDAASRKGKGMAAGWGKMTGAFAAVTGAVAGAAGAFAFLASSVNEARNARKAAAQTAAVMKSMGRTEAPKAINQMIDSLSQLSGIDDDELRSMTNVLLTFGQVTGKTFEKANALALDVSVAFGKDLNSSAVMVGKALNDPAKGLTALTRIGVSFTQKQADQVKAMMAVNDVAGAQKIIIQELQRQVGGSAAAQADELAKAQVAWGNLKEAIGEVLLSAMGSGSSDLTEGLISMTRWIKRNQNAIVGYLSNIISAILRIGGAWLLAEAYAKNAIGGMIVAFGTLVQAIGKLIPPVAGVGDNIVSMGQGIYDSGVAAGNAADKAFTLADSFQRTAEKAARAQERIDKVREAMAKVKDKEVKFTVRTIANTLADPLVGAPVNPDKKKDDGTSDTRVGMGVGSLGAAGLQAAHAMYSGALGGHSIMSGVRNYNLGSVHSDHRFGRAMDVQGPRLGAYAQAVRRNGGYAAMHGAGGTRHLHVVPQTRRPTPSRGGNSFHADVTVVNPGATMDIEAAVARGLRAAARQTRERT